MVRAWITASSRSNAFAAGRYRVQRVRLFGIQDLLLLRIEVGFDRRTWIAEVGGFRRMALFWAFRAASASGDSFMPRIFIVSFGTSQEQGPKA